MKRLRWKAAPYPNGVRVGYAVAVKSQSDFNGAAANLYRRLNPYNKKSEQESTYSPIRINIHLKVFHKLQA